MNRKKHTIALDEFNSFIIDGHIASASGKEQNKSLDIRVDVTTKRVWFEVNDHGIIVGKVPLLAEAIKLYNEL